MKILGGGGIRCLVQIQSYWRFPIERTYCWFFIIYESGININCISQYLISVRNETNSLCTKHLPNSRRRCIQFMGGGEWKELTMKNVSIESRSSVTILGTFLYFLVTNFVRKVAQMSHLFVGYLEKHHFLIKTVVTTFWATLYFNIWSHCQDLTFACLTASKYSAIAKQNWIFRSDRLFIAIFDILLQSIPLILIIIVLFTLRIEPGCSVTGSWNEKLPKV